MTKQCLLHREVNSQLGTIIGNSSSRSVEPDDELNLTNDKGRMTNDAKSHDRLGVG
jgi:hypothetical protein